MTATPQTPQILGDTYPTTVAIDGRDVRFQIKRLELGEFTAFDRDFDRVGRIHRRGQYRLDRHRQAVIDPITRQPKQRSVMRPLLVEGKPTDEMEPTTETVLETDAEVLARLDDEETDAQRDAREKRELADDEFAVDLVAKSLTAYVTCDPGQVIGATGPVVSGADICKHYGGRQDVIQRLFRDIYVQNAFTDEAKKKLASRLDSSPGSNASNPTAPGDGPGPTADAASPKDSASLETATASHETSSGAMALTS